MKLLPSSIIAATLSLAIQLSATAAVGADKLEEAIAKEKIFAADAKLRVAVDGSEAVLTTFKTDSATADDCKIDAVLVGKAVFAADPSLSRTVVRFHDLRNPKEYSEVHVSVGDVKAYGAGSISKEQLLSGIEFNKHEEPPVALAGSSPLTVVRPKEAIKTEPIAAPKVSAGMTSYKNYGLTLNYPSSWQIEYPKSGNSLARFFFKAQAGQSSIVELRVYSGSVSAANAAAIDPESLFGKIWEIAWMQSMSDLMGANMISRMGHHEHSHEHSREREHEHEGEHRWHRNHVSVAGVQVPPSIKVGQSKKLTAYQKAYWASAPMSSREYMRAVSFASSQYVYQLLLLCPEKEASSSNAEFEQVLSAIQVASNQKATTAKASK